MYRKIIFVQVRDHAIFEVVLTNRQPPASHNFIHHPREMTPTILSRTIGPQLLHVQISTEYHLPVHGLPSVLRRVPLGNGSSRSHSLALYHHQSQPEHFPQLRTGGSIGPHVRTPCISIIFVCACVRRDWRFEAFVDVKIPGAGDDLLSSAAGKPRYIQLKRLR